MYSQHGEDKWLENYLVGNQVYIKPLVVDAGCADGRTDSNSRLFIEKYNYSGILIDAREDAVELSMDHYKGVKRVQVVKAMLAEEEYGAYVKGEAHLAAIVKRKNSKSKTQTLSSIIGKKDVGLLSIDIEGMDTKVLKEVLGAGIKPDCIIIEANDSKAKKAQEKLLKKEYTAIKEFNVNTIYLKSSMLPNGK